MRYCCLGQWAKPRIREQASASNGLPQEAGSLFAEADRISSADPHRCVPLRV